MSTTAPALRNIDALKIHPVAHTKLALLCRCCPTEIGFYCVTHPDDPMYITDFVAPRQHCTAATFDFDPLGLPDIYDVFEARGIPVERFNRIIAHTHPGSSATPSGVDWTSFKEPTRLSLGHWGMLILARGGEMTFNLGVPVGTHIITVTLPVRILENAPFSDFDGEFSKEDFEAQLRQVVTRVPPTTSYNGPVRQLTQGTLPPRKPTSRYEIRDGRMTALDPADESLYEDLWDDTDDTPSYSLNNPSQPIAGRTSTKPKKSQKRAKRKAKQLTRSKTLSDGSKLILTSNAHETWNPAQVLKPSICNRANLRQGFDVYMPEDILTDIYPGIDPGSWDYSKKFALDLMVMCSEATDMYTTTPYIGPDDDAWLQEAWTLGRAYMALPVFKQSPIDQEIRSELRNNPSLGLSCFGSGHALTTGDDCLVWLLAILRREAAKRNVRTAPAT